MVDRFVTCSHTFSEPEVDVKLKGQLQDIMGWDDIIVVDHEGTVVGIARDCVPPKNESPLSLGDNFDAKYDQYLPPTVSSA